MSDESKDDVLELLSITNDTKDKDGFKKDNIKKVEIFANVQSTKRSEYYSAKRAGIDIDLTIAINAEDLELANQINEKGEVVEASKLIFENETYQIIRSYKTDEFNLELNCKRTE